MHGSSEISQHQSGKEGGEGVNSLAVKASLNLLFSNISRRKVFYV